jgi:hypothetical protein
MTEPVKRDRMLGCSVAGNFRLRLDYICCGKHYPGNKVRSRRRRRAAEKRSWQR